VPGDPRARSPEEVFDDHLHLAGEHRFDEDIARNVAPHCVILERRGIFHGRDGANSFVIDDGWIVAQTIHYTVESTIETTGAH
jgi:hypothetical protein